MSVLPVPEIQRPLQNECSRRTVNGLGAFGAAEIGVDHVPCDGDGGKALVPEGDGEVLQFQEIGGELAHRLTAWYLAAIHVERQADDEAADLPFGNEAQ